MFINDNKYLRRFDNIKCSKCGCNYFILLRLKPNTMYCQRCRTEVVLKEEKVIFS